MILPNFVVGMKLAIITQIILNSIGIVSLQDELEHGLATDCNEKGMKAYLILIYQKFSKFVTC